MLNRISASAQLYLLIFITATGLMGLGFYGIGSLKEMNENTRTLYVDRMLCIQQLLKIRFEYGTNILPIPQNIKNHTITFSEAKKRVVNAQAIIDSNWRAYKLSYETPEERLLVRQTESIKSKADEATQNLVAILSREDSSAVAGLIQKVTTAKTASFTLKVNQLIDLQVRVAKEILINNDKLYRVTSRNFFLFILLSLAIALSLSLYIIKNIRNLIRDTIAGRDIIKESDNLYRSILENASDAIYLVDNEGCFIEANDSMCKMTGYSKDELLQLKVEDVYDNDQFEVAPLNLSHIPYQSIFEQRRFIRKDGAIVEVEIYGKRLDIYKLMGVARDVTDRKKADELVLKEKELSETIVNSLPGIFYLRDEQGRALRWNKNLEEVTGYTAEEIEGALLRNYIAEEDLEGLQQAGEKTLKEGYATAEVRIVTKGGHMIPYLLIQRPVYYGGQLCILGTGIDISSRLRAEEELRSSEQKYKLLFESNPMPLWIVAKDDMTVMAANDAAAKLYGYTPEEVLNMDIKTQRPAKYWGKLIETYQTDVNEATDFGVIENIKKDGTKILVNIIAQDIIFEGRFARLSSTNDVTEKLKAEEELKLSRQNLERYNRELTLLNNINDIILRKQDEFDLYKDVCNCIIRSGGYKLAWVCYKPGSGEDQTVVPVEAAGAIDYLKEIKISLGDPQLSKGPTAIVLVTGKTFINNDVSNTSAFAPWLERAKKHGLFSSLVLALDLGEGQRGALSIYSDHTNAFDEQEVYILERLAANVSIAVRDMRIANELIQSEARFRGAFEESSIGVGIVSLNGKWLKVNSALCEMLGYEEHELLELTFQQMTHPDDLKSDLNFLQQALTGEKEYHRAEKRYFHKDGNIVWVNLNVALIRDKNNHPLYFVSQIENVTERVESQIKFQNLVENFIVSVYIHQNGRIVYVNPRLMEESGYAAEDLIGKPIEHFIYKEDLDLVKKAVEAREKAHMDTVRYEARFVKKDGQPIWFEVFGSRTVYEGAPALMGTLVNISERKAFYDKLKKSEANLRSIFNSTDVSYLMLDKTYNIVSLNQQMKDIYRDNVGVILNEGDNLIALIRPERREMLRELYDSVLLTKRPSKYESSFQDGVTRYFATSVFPITVGDETIGICIATIDITEQKNALEKLEETNENLQKHAKELATSNAELEQFAYVASHDLQEPLRMVTSFMAQLERKYGDVVEEKGRQYIHFAIDGAKRMRQIILDLLDFSRVGKTEGDMEDVDFNKLLNEILALYRQQIEEEQAKVSFENLPTLHTYKTPARQVIQNLIGNSLKYHRAGVSPIITIGCKETKKHFQFSVEDNGIGIAPEYFDKIFIIFQRLHNKEEYSGTGMGLAISKKIVENLGGKIWVESEPGKGSTFYFTLPKSNSL